jgi:hypothetical protein
MIGYSGSASDLSAKWDGESGQSGGIPRDRPPSFLYLSRPFGSTDRLAIPKERAPKDRKGSGAQWTAPIKHSSSAVL